MINALVRAHRHIQLVAPSVPGGGEDGGGDPGPGIDEPVFNPATGTMHLLDNIDAYVSIEAMGDDNGSTIHIVPHPAPVTVSQDVDPDRNQLITGRNGSGKALRMVSSGAHDNSSTFLTMPESQPSFQNGKTHHFTYWFRVTFEDGFDESTSFSVKWFEMWWKSGAGRVEINTRYGGSGAGGYNGPVTTMWQVIGDADAGQDSTQPVGPYPVDVFDGQWHRWTCSVKAHTSSSNKDGFVIAYVDGTKIIHLSQDTVDVVPPGAFGGKAWCVQAEVDALHDTDCISSVHWGETQTTDTSPWTYDVDDVQWWSE